MNLSRQIAYELRQTGVITLTRTCPLQQTVTYVKITFEGGRFDVSMVTFRLDGVLCGIRAGAAGWKSILRAIKGYARERREIN
jgi:hypothetical protein